MVNSFVANSFINNVEHIWQKNKLGSGIFIIGTILCIVGVIFSIIWELNFSSSPDEISYIITAIGIGIPFILSGINIILKPPRRISIILMSPLENYINYIKENNILFVGWMISTVFIISFFISYPKGWYYPQHFIIYMLYAIGICLLIINTFLNLNEKEIETTILREKLEKSIEEKNEMRNEDTIPDYIAELADKLKKDIDNGAKNISERTTSSIKKYKLDNERLHNEVQKFKQRMEKEKDEFKKHANERIIKNLMDTLYNIDELKQYKDKDTNYNVDDIDRIKESLHNVLKNEDIEIIKPSIGDNFDDKKCCAIQVVETDRPEKKIVDVRKVGYMFKSGKVIKYAEVIVSKIKPKIDDKIADNKIEKAKISGDVKIDEKTKISGDVKIDEKTKISGDVKTDEKTKISGDVKIDDKVKDEKTKIDDKVKDEKTKIDDKVKDEKTKIEY